MRFFRGHRHRRAFRSARPRSLRLLERFVSQLVERASRQISAELRNWSDFLMSALSTTSARQLISELISINVGVVRSVHIRPSAAKVEPVVQVRAPHSPSSAAERGFPLGCAAWTARIDGDCARPPAHHFRRASCKGSCRPNQHRACPCLGSAALYAGPCRRCRMRGHEQLPRLHAPAHRRRFRSAASRKRGFCSDDRP